MKTLKATEILAQIVECFPGLLDDSEVNGADLVMNLTYWLSLWNKTEQKQALGK